ncbi:bifunctional enoyl-CoA hydratase/phosphate acetyltransferase [Polaromonas sp. CG_9.11]|uniref:bifunctional enoyl-CoA hydratase/phosphate acetyltransferase n=1 Tax=Polaromonas sp. CG_9.11 TaxID=2787730 RepID=UPI0018CBE5F1|nr:bifunctional enoyl-CoA hydratase/phosphate acetyltransferase [Polaromonas sp. CG_9.11]MBG6074621.1 phosphotransacetylase/acyl dehydratase [Polaromonas sp. CG_9.11]
MDALITQPGPPADFLENHPFDTIRVGDGASLQRQVTQRDIQLFAAVSGDVNPAHVDALYAQTSHFHEIIAHGMLGGSLISTVLGTQFPGPGTIYLGQTLEFLKPVHIGDTLSVAVTVTALEAAHRHVWLHTTCTDQDGDVVIDGEAQVVAPAEKLRIARTDLPEPLMADKNLRYDQLLNAARALPRISMGVVHPCSREALEGALDADRLGLIEAILIGPESRIRSLAAECRLDLTGYRIIDVPHSHAAAARAVELARAGEVEALMKGSLHSDELLSAVVNAQFGLRTERRVSHVFVLDVPRYPKPLLITDAAINVAPDFDAKVDIVQNAIDLAHALGIDRPKVAVLSAVETVTPKLRSSMDAAALSKMADRGQITGGLVDGPLAFDNAVSLAAAKTKGIQSEVAGDADILVVPDLESGNMLAKQLEYLGGAQAAGLVMGAKVPIVLTSRADSAHSRIASCAMALLLTEHRRKALAPA